MTKKGNFGLLRYKPINGWSYMDFQYEHSLDLILSPGCYSVEVEHLDADLGLPIEFCGNKHYIVCTLIVTDNGTDVELGNRLTGQVLIITPQENQETKIYLRTRVSGVWSEWRSLAVTGMFDDISSTDELLATVESLVTENTRAKQVEQEVKRSAVDISSLACTACKKNVTVTGKSMDGEIVHTVEMPTATIEKAGVMSAEDKVKLYNAPTGGDIPMLAVANYFNPDDADFVKGKILNAEGKLIDNSGYAVTGYIPLNSLVDKLIITENGVVDSANGGAICFYDKNKNYLFGKNVQSINSIACWEYGVAYVRFTLRYFANSHYQIEQGEQFTEKIPVNTTYYKKEYFPQKGINPKHMSEEFGLYKTLNLLNPNELQKGKTAYISNGELKFTSSPTVTASGFIGVKPLTTYTFRYSFQYFFLDADKKVIGGKNELIGTATVTTPEDCRYLVINFYNERSGMGLYNLDATARVYEGDVLYPYIPYGVASDKIQTYLHQQSISSLGSDALRAPRATVAANTNITLNSQGYPHSIKNNQIVFHGKFDTFGTLTIGRGFTDNAYSGCRFEITGTAITLFKNDGSWIQQATIEHGLEMNTYIKVLISERKNKVFVLIHTLTGSFEHEFDYWGANGVIAFKSSTAMTDTVFSQSNPSFKCPVWMFGDSYYGASTENRQLYWLRKWGYDNTLVQSFGGQGSNDAYLDLLRCLDFGTPMFLVWSLGMNDDNDTVLSDITTGVWYATYQKVKKICEAMDIELILTTIPEVRGGYSNKDAISEVVRNSGLRYIDAAKAVSSNADGEWYGNGTEYDYQSSDNVHPSKYGAKAIATQFLIDFPEIMQY